MQQILIIDFGSQYTELIGRTLRELGVRSVIFSPSKSIDYLEKNKKPKGIILSGGSSSVNDKSAPSLPLPYFWELIHSVPILGICYGMQWIAKHLGGQVISNIENKEYGETSIVCAQDPLFQGLLNPIIVWSSHGDSVKDPPIGFYSIAFSGKNNFAAMANSEKRIWGVQFHPEVVQTKDDNQILKNFVFDICGCEIDWQPTNIVFEIQRQVLGDLGDKNAVIGFSGGVDSSTLSAILTPVLGKKLLAVCIDSGALRDGELAEIKQTAKNIGVRLKIIRVGGEFQEVMGKTKNAETKRRIFSKLYGQILAEVVREHNAIIIQGSLASDFIESGRVGGADKIKLHHNTGICGLHPFRELFK
ncbi:MAG: glutamine-hydrolyzing GMP synthase [Candidatus Pacebacteria bacterium]|nr:glutamine-hydrolyzing GMP synthase [Candidatus Paceibacterota bacterium]